MKRFVAAAVIASPTTLAASAASAKQVTDKSEFLNIVSGKTISRPLVKISVTSDGRIFGKGAKWPVTGNWSWKGGYFCRSLDWGGSDLGYDCQMVTFENGSIRFTSQRGKGQSAAFSLR